MVHKNFVEYVSVRFMVAGFKAGGMAYFSNERILTSGFYFLFSFQFYWLCNASLTGS